MDINDICLLMGILTVYLVRLYLTNGKYCPTNVYRACPSNNVLNGCPFCHVRIGYSWQSRARQQYNLSNFWTPHQGSGRRQSSSGVHHICDVKMHINVKFCFKFIRTHNVTVSQANVVQSSVSHSVTVCVGHSEQRWVSQYFGLHVFFYFWTPHRTFLFRLHILVGLEAGNHPDCSTAAGWRGEGNTRGQRSVTRGRSSNDRCVAVAGKEQTTLRATGDRCRLLRNSSASLSRSTQDSNVGKRIM